MRLDHVKFTLRVWLARLGLYDRFEHWRMCRHIRPGRPHEADFACFRHLADRAGLFLDVGANFGQSALSFRLFNRSSPIVAFEPNAALAWHLDRIKARLGDGFDYRLEGLGAEPAERTLYFPVVAGVPLSQDATFFPETIHGDGYRDRVYELTGRRHYTIVERVLKIVRLDDLGLRPTIVKLDVQGGELAALQGMPRTIDRDRPVFLIENNPAANAFLTARDYRQLVYRPDRDALVPADGGPVLNYFLVPAERLAEWPTHETKRPAA